MHIRFGGARVRRSTWVAVACGVAFVGVLFLFVFPTNAWLTQRRDRVRIEDELRQVTAENRLLDERVKRLQTPEEIERLARERFYLVRPGEEAFVIQPPPVPARVARAAVKPESRRPKGLWARVWARAGSLF